MLVTGQFEEDDASENAASRLYVERGPISYHEYEAPLPMLIVVEPLMLLLTVDALVVTVSVPQSLAIYRFL
jgi:hypothetical protein